MINFEVREYYQDDEMLKIFKRLNTKEDLTGILEIYNQPHMDNDKALSKVQAEVIFKKISNYPNYKIFVTVDDEKIIGAFSVAIMDNLAHMEGLQD